MITELLTNSDPMTSFGLVCKIDSKSQEIPPETAIVDVCDCQTSSCEYFEMAFFDISEDEYKNDKTSLICNLIDSSGSIQFFIISEDGTEEEMTDDTYGEIFDFGSRKGYIVDWLKVKNELGAGFYYLKVLVDNFDRITEKNSHKYFCTSFKDDTADQTVRIETINSGTILNGFDYSGLEWPRMIRVYGKLWKEKPTPELDSYEDTNRIKRQIQDRVTTNITLELELTPKEVLDQLIYNEFLMNDLFLTNYDIFVYKQYVKIPVILSEIEEPEFFAFNKNAVAAYTFEINNGGHIKRNI